MNISEFNYIEASLWFTCAVILFCTGIKVGKRSPYFKIILVVVPAFIAFGISDIIEVQTGTWWRPVSLLFLKAACVITIAGCYYHYYKINKGNT